MRLISQNGNVDIPYEQAHILHANECVMAIVGDKEYTMGKYSSMKKSYKTMEMLRSAYVGMPIIFQNVDVPEDIAEKLKEWNKQGIICVGEEAEQKVEYVNNTIFQFPQDDEIEV